MDLLSNEFLEGMSSELKKNLAYNIQYFQLQELKLHNVIEKNASLVKIVPKEYGFLLLSNEELKSVKNYRLDNH